MFEVPFSVPLTPNFKAHGAYRTSLFLSFRAKEILIVLVARAAKVLVIYDRDSKREHRRSANRGTPPG